MPVAFNLASHRNSPARSTKSTTSHAYGALSACKLTVSGSISLPSRGSFHLSLTVLFAIGHMVVFSLTGWSPCLPSGFLVSRRTPDPARPLHNFAYGIVTLSDLPFKVVRLSCQVSPRSPYPAGITTRGLGSSDFARHYFRNRFYFLFLRVLRCFSSPGSLLYPYVFRIGYRDITRDEFPHSDICGSSDVCSSPQLFAAYHVLLRRHMPRHPP